MPQPAAVLAQFTRVLFFIVIVISDMAMRAQITGTTYGIAPFGSYTQDVLGEINAYNLNNHLVIPIRHKGQFYADLQFENLLRWKIVQIPNGGGGFINEWTYDNSVPFGRLVTPLTSALFNAAVGTCSIDGSSYYQWFSIDANGSQHKYPQLTDFSGNCYPASAISTDAYGYTMNTAAHSTTDLSGNINVSFPPTNTLTDPNGNAFSQSSQGVFTDYTGTTFLTPVYGSANQTYSWVDSSSNTQTINVTLTSYNLQLDSGCGTSISATGGLPTTISLPDGSHYLITYEQTPGYGLGYTTGRIKSITLPTAAVITYNYTSGSCPGNLNFTRATPDGTWTYANSNGSTVITSPSGQSVTYTFSSTGVEIKKVYKEANGTIIATIETCYNGTTLANCSSQNIISPFPPTQVSVYTELPSSSGKISRKDTFYNSASQITRVDSYDFGAGAAGALLQKVTYTYGSWNGSSCAAVGSNITDHGCQTTVLDGSGAIKSQVQNTYDSHGNLLTQRNLVSGSTYLSKSSTYNANGTPATATDINGTVGTYSGYVCNGQLPGSYSAAGLTTISTWNCNGGVKTSVQDANNQTTTYAYNDPFWRPTSVTDPLGNVTTTSYTPTSVDTSMVFNSNNSTTEAVTTLDSLGRKSLVQKRLSPISSLYDTVKYSYDANGRLLTVSRPCQVALGSGCVTPVTTFGYDAAWRPTSTIDGGSGTVTTTYTGNDVLTTLGPAPAGESTKKRQYEYDGLSRLTSVCEITGGSGSGSCGQYSPQTGYWTKYMYDPVGNLTSVTQNVQSSPTQTRSYSYDGLSRMLSETNPESGTTTYIYDSTSGADTCNPAHTSYGDLLRKTDANGNYVCYIYDALHRVTDIGNSIDNATNFCKRFRYDSTNGVLGAKPTGVTVSNSMGRVAEASTDNCPPAGIPPSSILTDEWLSYDANGNQTDLYESTLHSGGYYHSHADFYANGTLQDLSGIGQQTQYNYGIDGEGRLKTTSQGSTTYVTGTTYNPASQPLTVSLKAGDSDNYAYDPNTGRMSNFTFTVGSTPKSMVGGLTWNPNGSLSKLAMTDGFNAAGNQTCRYGDPSASVAGYDDLSRLISANCGSVWSQSFSYDPFGNLAKSGSLTWNPAYNQATNRYTLAGTSYDADGNLLNDTFHTYTWNVHGKLASVDATTTLTYDANDRVVEKNASGTIREIEYSPVGKSCVMNGTTQVQCYVPLPGGEILSPGPDTFWHVDWLGSVRLGSSASTRAITFDRAFAPFGETYNTVTGGTSNPQFAGLTQDTITGEYDTDARELHPSQGRWISPDPAGMGAADPTNPQSWNRYAYVLNNPLSLTDPDGLWCVWDNGSGHDDDSSDGGLDEDTCKTQGGHWDPKDTVANVLQDGDGNIKSITYTIGVTCTTVDCGAGETLEAFDAGLQDYSVLDLNQPDLLETLWLNRGVHVEFVTEPRVTWRQWFNAALDCATSPDPLPKLSNNSGGSRDQTDILGGNSLDRSNTIHMPNKQGRPVAVSGRPSPGLDNGAAAAGMADDWGRCVQYELDNKYW